MMAVQQMVQLAARRREETNPRQLRREGQVPAIVYGPGTDPAPVQVERLHLQRLLEAGGRRSLIALNVAEEDEERIVMLKEIQMDHLGDEILHVDFYQVQMNEELRTTVALEFSGETYATREGGVIQYTQRELPIACLPRNMPDVIEVDVAHLDIGESVTVSDLDVPEGVRFLDDPDTVVATLVLPRTEVEEEEEPAMDAELLEPELIGEEDEDAEELDLELEEEADEAP